MTTLYTGLTTEQAQFVRVIFEKLGEWPACSLAAVLAGEISRFVGISDGDIDLIRDCARMENFALPESAEQKK